MLKKIIIILLIASMALGYAAQGTAAGAGEADAYAAGAGASGAGGAAAPPPATAGAGHPGTFVEGEVLAEADSMEQALEIASAYGFELKSYAYGIAVFEAPDPELAVARSQLMRRPGLPELGLNTIYSLIDDGAALQYSGAAPPVSSLGSSSLAALSGSTEEWHHELLDTQRAWGLTKGAGVVVAVIDTGIDVSHPAFAGRIMANSYNSQSNRVGLQYVQDDNGHGTHVSGIVAASSAAISGIAPEASILAIKANMPSNPELLDKVSTIRGINYAADNGAKVINLSYGSPYSEGPDPQERRAIVNAVAKGATVVSSAGNDRLGNAGYPAAYPETIAVSALREGALFDSTYSNYGLDIELSAPGTTVFSTMYGGRYGFSSGTSVAAPSVSGVAALVVALNPGYTPAQVRAALRDTARQKGALGHDPYYGYGIVNAYSAVLGAEALHRVDYDFNYTTRDPVTVRAVGGSVLFEPNEPQRDAFVFDGWFDRADGGSIFDFGSPITENMTLYAQWTVLDPGMYAAVFPDPAFCNEVLKLMNLTDGGTRTPSSTVTFGDFVNIGAIASLDVSDMNIWSLEGIEHFSMLQSLYCIDNRLTELDVSKNTVLRTLSCGYNNLAKLDISGNDLLWILWASFNQLASLDLSKNAALQEIYVSSNRLTKLDVSKNGDLFFLDAGDNLLTELDLSGAPKLDYLTTDSNLLTKLDISKNAVLKNIICHDNRLAELDISGNAQLTMLLAHNNRLTGLDTSKNEELAYLDCHINEIASLDLSNNYALIGLWVSGNRLKALDVSNNRELEHLVCYENYMGDDPDKSVAGWRALFSFAGSKEDGSRFQYMPQNSPAPTPTTAPTPTPVPPKPTPTTAPPPPSFPEMPPSSTAPTPAPTAPPTAVMPPVLTPAPSRPNPFTDVSEGDWFYSAVRFAYLNDLFGGTSATTFSPGQPMTRAMFATVLWRLDGTPGSGDTQPAPQGPRFSDVAESAWFYGGVSWAARSGVVSGVGGGRFDPGAPVTREQMAVMLMNYFRFKGISLNADTGAAAFADEAKISGWAKASVIAIQRAGLIGGKPGNLFDPQGSATRAEVAAIFSRIDSVIK